MSNPTPLRIVGSRSLRPEENARLAALLACCGSLFQDYSLLQTLKLREWRRLLRWLDLSGLALCFYDCISQTRQERSLPTPIAAALRRRLEENTQRTESMLAESVAIQSGFQKACLSYALLKGLSFWPNSVARPELRLQFDLDYLVAEPDIPEARKILARRGYRLYASNGRSWEFKRNEKPGVTLKEMYKDTGSFRVELHSESSCVRTPQLQTVERREFGWFRMPVLAPVDLLLGQGMHAFKDICSEFVRPSHLLEFRRHVLFRHDDRAFWGALRDRASGNPRAAVGLGVATLLISQVTGEFAPDALTNWTVDRLTHPAKLWVETYGNRAVLGSYPGSKLYLLLQREINLPERTSRRAIWHSILPSAIPPPVIRGLPGDSFSVRLGRYRMYLDVLCSRLRFHLTEGLRFAHEARRWRQLLQRAGR